MKLGNKTAKVAPFSESSRSLAFWILPKLHEHWNLIAKIKLKLLGYSWWWYENCPRYYAMNITHH